MRLLMMSRYRAVRISSASLAILAAIRRASSFVSSLAANRRLLEIEPEHAQWPRPAKGYCQIFRSGGNHRPLYTPTSTVIRKVDFAGQIIGGANNVQCAAHDAR